MIVFDTWANWHEIRLDFCSVHASALRAIKQQFLGKSEIHTTPERLHLLQLHLIIDMHVEDTIKIELNHVC